MGHAGRVISVRSHFEMTGESDRRTVPQALVIGFAGADAPVPPRGRRVRPVAGPSARPRPALHSGGRQPAAPGARDAPASEGARQAAGPAVRPASASATVRAVMLTMRRTVAEAVRMCTGLVCTEQHRSDRDAAAGGRLQQVVGDVGGVDVGQHQQVGVALQGASAASCLPRAHRPARRRRAFRRPLRARAPGSRSSASVRRIFCALGWSLVPKLECDSSAALGLRPKRCISSAAMTVISASSSALGSALTWVSTRKTWRPGSIRPFMQA